MPSAVYTHGRFVVDDFLLPPLEPWQIRVRPIANGICGSDLSAWVHTDDFLATNAAAHQPGYVFDKDRPVVFGHEFTAEVLELGPEVEDYHVGELLFILPWVLEGDLVRTVGYSNRYPGGMSTEAIVGAGMHLPLDGVDPILAATIEPIATGTNAVRRTGIEAGEGAIVTGVGPVGLGAVVELAARGVHPIIASDPSPKRREIALAYGATVAVDPYESDPIDAWRERAEPGTRLYVIDASGAPGLLGRMMDAVPEHTVFSIVGANAEPETIRTMGAVLNNITLLFASGPARTETRYESAWRALEHLREGRYDPSLMVTAYTGLGGAQAAFEALRPSSDSIEQVKILVVPELDTDSLLGPAEVDHAALERVGEPTRHTAATTTDAAPTAATAPVERDTAHGEAASIAGSWQLEILSPLGRQSFTVDLADGDPATGVARNAEGSMDLLDVVLDGATAKFRMRVDKPMKLTLAWTLTADGDVLTGSAKPGAFPAQKVTGNRV